MINSIAVYAANVAFLSAAKEIAMQCHLPCISETSSLSAYSHLLVLTEKGLGITTSQDIALKHVFYVNFLDEKIRYRQIHANLRNELIARAIGLKPTNNPRIVDVTAGLGRDSFVLAALGFQVTLIERSAIMHALLQDALTRAANTETLAPIIKRLTLIKADATQWLSEQQPFDVVYLDPMYPPRQKSAKVKKDIALLQTLIGYDTDTPALLQAALTCTLKRVVIKRPRLAVDTWEPTPSFTLTGKNSRFDVYLKHTK